MPEVVRDAVFGNVGTMISFRVGPGDSSVLGQYFEPVFEATDLTRLNNQNIFLSMIIDGEKAPAFSGKTLRMPDPENDMTDKIIEQSRTNYASDRIAVEADIRSRTDGGEPTPTARDASTPAPAHAAAATASAVQNPNRPKSEFLSNLKNPNLSAAPTQPRRDNRDNRGASRGGDQRRNDGRDARQPQPQAHASSGPDRS